LIMCLVQYPAHITTNTWEMAVPVPKVPIPAGRVEDEDAVVPPAVSDAVPVDGDDAAVGDAALVGEGAAVGVPEDVGGAVLLSVAVRDAVCVTGRAS
jgi:hypothetical protein